MRPRFVAPLHRVLALIVSTLVVAACTSAGSTTEPSLAIVDIKLIAFNDFHGNLEPPHLAVSAPAPDGSTVLVPAGGAAYIASAIKALRAANPNNAVVTAGDLIGASPLPSALFLDEPTIEVANQMKIDFHAPGNHEFDKGQDELLRMQRGGCARYTLREPCRFGKGFHGADFPFLTANTFKADGSTLFPGTGVKTFGTLPKLVTVGFIGLTLKGTPAVVTPAGVKGLVFKDEADIANALVPVLKAQGAQILVVVVHEGARTPSGDNDTSCAGLTGDIFPILERLDSSIDVVISGHTHNAYVCDYSNINTGKPFLLTSAGLYGTRLTDIDLRFDPVARKMLSKTAKNIIVQSEPYAAASGNVIALTPFYPAYAKDAAVDAIVAKAAAAAEPLALRQVGVLSSSATRASVASGESPLGNMVADSQLEATAAAERGGSKIAFMNPGGVRADLLVAAGGGPVNYGQLFAVQPFGNNLVVKSMSGALIRKLLEQQFDSGSNSVARPRVLLPSLGFNYSYDLAAPAGSRISAMRLNGIPVDEAAVYRVTMNAFLASGGDNFTAFAEGEDAMGGDVDLDAFEAYLSARSINAPPATNRISRR